MQKIIIIIMQHLCHMQPLPVSFGNTSSQLCAYHELHGLHACHACCCLHSMCGIFPLWWGYIARGINCFSSLVLCHITVITTTLPGATDGSERVLRDCSMLLDVLQCLVLLIGQAALLPSPPVPLMTALCGMQEETEWERVELRCTILRFCEHRMCLMVAVLYTGLAVCSCRECMCVYYR